MICEGRIGQNIVNKDEDNTQNTLNNRVQIYSL